ncbi:MAG: PAS/PAC sensor signal transduction histidine kinase [candidate division WWE3 bacterium GW2011_GWC1_42_102]|nr:MAG: PAS/PAC sensor signal transduction histidine kinase [candidate division WWE3 bacterium GW2011_GWC1_42_102]
METYNIWLIIAESILLLIISVILFRKSSELNKLLEQISKLKSDGITQSGFFGGNKDYIPMLVHELRAPLSVIKGASDLLLKIVADILDVSKIGAGRFEINKVYANLNDTLKEEWSYFNPLAQVKGVTLEIELNENFGNFSFDPERIKQVMGNLLSNAIKFTPEGGKVTVSANRFDHHAEVTVADTGLGTGLGLVIVKAIVEAHKGDIRVEDNKPTGAKFVFTLPL